MSINAVDRLTHAVFYHEPQHQPGDIDIDRYHHLQGDAVAYRNNIDTLVLFIEEAYIVKAGFTGARNSARLPPGRRSCRTVCCSFSANMAL